MSDTSNKFNALKALDCIERQAAIDVLKVFTQKDTLGFTPKQIVEALPSAQPERKKGMWNMIQGNIVVCSECGMGAPQVMTGCLINRHLEPNRTNFCPNCGADMRPNNAPLPDDDSIYG